MISEEQFIRSVNIWKISDGESIKDKYVEMYLFMEEMFTDLKMYKTSSFTKSIFYLNDDKYIIFEDCGFYGEINIDIVIYDKFKEKFNIGITRAEILFSTYFKDMKNYNRSYAYFSVVNNNYNGYEMELI